LQVSHIINSSALCFRRVEVFQLLETRLSMFLFVAKHLSLQATREIIKTETK